MLSLCLASVLVGCWTNEQKPPGEIIRDSYGIPHIFAPTLEGAFFHAGYAVAEDRIWQMELARRSARGKLSEILGRSALASDRDAIRFGYTDEEYEAFFRALDPKTQQVLESYTRGINQRIQDLIQANELPAEFGGNPPQPWTPTDCLAIAVNMVRLFGRGGAGDLRNLLALTYLQGRLKERAIDAFQDLLWENDDSAIPTCPPQDDPFKNRSPFLPAKEEVLRAHISKLPPVNLLELLPAIRMAEQADLREIAAHYGLLYRWGSYAVAISPQKSALGVPLLLSGPQMGFQIPSVVHQMSIACPEYTAVGMDVPGIPGILIGHSDTVAWGLTSGVADTDDVFFVKLNPENPNQYFHQGTWKNFDVWEVTVPVKGEEPAKALREMTVYGPVILKSPSTGVAYVRASTLWKNEVAGLSAMLKIPQARNAKQVHSLALSITANFNLFLAGSNGDIAWFFCGRVPLRSPKVDPRLPAPGDGEHDWQGILPPEQMPYVINPKQGWIANWNNKPVSWWPNHDTPAWGRIFRNELLVKYLRSKEKVSPQDLEYLIKHIATHRIEPEYFLKDLLSCGGIESATPLQKRALSFLRFWDGNFLDGSVAPTLYQAWFQELQKELFQNDYGNFLSPQLFYTAVQPTVVWNALRGRTRMDYLKGRKQSDVLWTAFQKAVSNLEQERGSDPATWTYSASGIYGQKLPRILYDNRGTYLQIVELWQTPRGRYVAPPGVSENPRSPHYSDQHALSANWALTPMLWRREDFKNR
jgi:penicillin amidase